MQVERAEKKEPVNANIEGKTGRARSLANLRPAKPGECRNPRGRPKKDYDLAKLAQKHAEKAVQTLADCLMDAHASWPAKVSAAAELLDRGFGRAPQSLDVKHELSFSDQFEQFVRQLSTRQNEKVVQHVEYNSIDPKDG